MPAAPAIIMGAAAVGGAVISSQAAKSAASKTAAAAQESAKTQLDMFNLTRQDQAPWIQAGTGAVNKLQELIPQGPGEFKESPGYQFTLNEGLRGIERAAASTGRLGSGASVKASARFAEDLASQEYDNFLNRWYKSLDPYFSLANLGQTSAGQIGQNALYTGRGVGADYLTAGEARAAGTIGHANALNQVIGYLGNAGAQYIGGGQNALQGGYYGTQGAYYRPGEYASYNFL